MHLVCQVALQTQRYDQIERKRRRRKKKKKKRRRRGRRGIAGGDHAKREEKGRGGIMEESDRVQHLFVISRIDVSPSPHPVVPTPWSWSHSEIANLLRWPVGYHSDFPVLSQFTMTRSPCAREKEEWSPLL